MATADFNGDGNLDLAVADAGSATVSVSLGTATGTFQPSSNYAVTAGCAVNYLAAADFNKDGHMDLLAACVTGTSLVFLAGKGDGTFGAATTIALPLPAFTGDVVLGGNIQPAIADFNSDGTLDVILPLAVLQSSTLITANAYLLPGNGDGTFQAAQAMPIFADLEAISFAAADFNGDGKMDVAALVIDNSGQVTARLLIALGQGDGSFHAGGSYSAGTGFNMTAGDVNGDGKADVVLAGGALDSNPVEGSVAVYLSNGDGTMKAPVTYNYAANSLIFGVAIADVEGTGKQDIVAALWTGLGTDLSSASTSILVLPGNGDGTFAPAITASSLGQAAIPWLITGDFNNDGRVDLAFPSFPVTILSGLTTSVNLNYLTAEIIATLSAFPDGSAEVLLNSSPGVTFSNANAAGFQRGPMAQDSIIAAFGGNLSVQTATTLTLGTSLGGVTVNVEDSAGTTRPAELFYVSPGQVNYAMPAGTATGTATITIDDGIGRVSATQEIVAVAPGLFSVSGIAAANVVTFTSGTQTAFADAFQAGTGGIIVPAPIHLGTASQQVYLELYGTGIRHASTVTANIGSQTGLPVAFAPQGQYAGEDQVNVLLPQSLTGAGVISVTITADGLTSNAVQIQIE